MIVAPPPGVDVLGPRVPAGARESARGRALQLGPFSNHTPLEPVGIGGRLAYSFDSEAIRVEPSEIATAETYVAFEGATAWGDRSKLPFRVTTTNWQESDRLLAGLMTAFGASTTAIPRACPASSTRRSKVSKGKAWSPGCRRSRYPPAQPAIRQHST